MHVFFCLEAACSALFRSLSTGMLCVFWVPAGVWGCMATGSVMLAWLAKQSLVFSPLQELSHLRPGFRRAFCTLLWRLCLFPFPAFPGRPARARCSTFRRWSPWQVVRLERTVRTLLSFACGGGLSVVRVWVLQLGQVIYRAAWSSGSMLARRVSPLSWSSERLRAFRRRPGVPWWVQCRPIPSGTRWRG